MKEIRDKMKEIRNNCAQYPSSRQKWKRDKCRNEKEINAVMIRNNCSNDKR